MTDKEKSLTFTLPRLGLGLQGSTMGIILWLGGQASSFVDEIKGSLTGLSDRVTSLESAVSGVGVDVVARADAVRAVEQARELDLLAREQDMFLRSIAARVKKIECVQEGRTQCD